MRGHRFVRTGSPIFDPTTLSLIEWQHANYTTPGSGIWNDSSGSGFNWAGGTAFPSAGTAVNGFTPALFTATSSQYFTSNALSNTMGASAWGGWALVFINSIAVSGLTLPANGNDMLFCSSGTGVWGIIFNATGPTVTQHVLNGSGVDFGATASISTGAWQLIQWSFDATNISIRVNGNARVNTACTSIFSRTANMDIGRNVSANHFFDGIMLEAGFSQGSRSDADFDNVRAYCGMKYGVSV